MTVKDLIDAAMKELRVDGRTKAGRELKREQQKAVDALNKLQWEFCGDDPFADFHTLPTVH